MSLLHPHRMYKRRRIRYLVESCTHLRMVIIAAATLFLLAAIMYNFPVQGWTFPPPPLPRTPCRCFNFNQKRRIRIRIRIYPQQSAAAVGAQQQRRWSDAQQIHLSMSSADLYSSMTVKELRQLVKDRSGCERGILSRLKRKHELIEYLKPPEVASDCDTYDHRRIEPIPKSSSNAILSWTDSSISPASPARSANVSSPPLQRSSSAQSNQHPQHSQLRQHEKQYRSTPKLLSKTLRMPPLDGTLPVDSLSSSKSHNARASPKELLLEDVYRRYPLLLEQKKHLQQVNTLSSESIVTQQHANGYGAVVNDTDEESNAAALVDVRMHHPMLRSQNCTSCDMDLVFVGTASCTPGSTRGVSCTALRLNWRRSRNVFVNGGQQPYVQSLPAGTWLFDVGECTQLQIQRTSAVKPRKITKIFLTHAHGDHTFGLPGLLCLMGQEKDRSDSVHGSTFIESESAPSRIVDIYGPQGLRTWLRVAIRYSVSRIVPPYRVHELMNVPMAPEWGYNPRNRRWYYRGNATRSTMSWKQQLDASIDNLNWVVQARNVNVQPSTLYGEVAGGRDIYPIYNHDLSYDRAPVWEVEDEGDVRVYASPMSHGIPCVGYMVEELSQPGRLRHELVAPIVRRNVHALRAAGFTNPMKAMAVIKNLSPGTVFTFPDGTVVSAEEAVEAPQPGRKVVICGDTGDCRSMRILASDADVIVHEATNTFLAGVDKPSNASLASQLRSTTRDAIAHGHSTPFLAGEFAKSVRARRLVLNHFSPRYKGDSSVDSLSIMMRIERQAMEASSFNETQVAAAWDLMVLPLPRR